MRRFESSAASYRTSEGRAPAAQRKMPSQGRGGRCVRRGARLALLAGVWLGSSCATTPITGTTYINAFSPAQDVEIGSDAWEQVLAEGELVTSGPDRKLVERVMARLVAVADDPGYAWEVRLLRDDTNANAFALPGGKMAVYSGILPVTQSEAGLAVVMGHEIAHVIARHGTQRLTASGLANEILALLGNEDAQELARMTLGLLALPYGRSHESEADHIGLIYMARAGYDPEEAIRFWERMNAASGGGGPPEFFSTHPSHATRIEDLRALLPKAREAFRDPSGPGS